MNKIQSIINDYFDFDFFWRQDSQRKQLIENLAKDFQKKHPNAIVNIIHQVKAAYPALTIKRYTYFIEDDRCLTFEIQFPNQDNVVGAISIFGYFLAWNSMPGKSGFDKYIYENDNAILNQLFQTIVNPEFGNMLEWVSKDMISEEIEIFNHDKILGVGDNSPIYVANLLTRFH
ncbi:hypothetical protein [Sphingobacterium deserti]|uniref:Uncharacterized protein n=1 Tax=Sphingobacterium deserti TaxID=1229276 RepID=A0A0B8T111_9SPHI|nr:hypothetical protein [Sphingobacterium deserti]KGE14251.1 hypothetical protein DI53_2081 [Sphingobacterium deserti]